MKRVLAGMLAGFVVSAVLPHSPVAQATTSQAAAPAYLRANISVCAPSKYGTRCQSDYVESALSSAQARKATVEVTVYARQPQGGGPANPPLDKSSHTLRLVMAGTYYATDAPATLVRTWVGPIRGRQVWKLPTLLPAPLKGQRSYNIYYLSISVDGWPTLHTSTLRMTP
jgi:hypothetical protein